MLVVIVSSSLEVQRYAYNAVRSGFTNELLRRLAGFGSSGRHGQNIHRQSLDMFARGEHDKLVRPIGGSCVTHIVYPHELMNYIHRNFPHAFEHHLGANPTKVKDFWRQFLSTPYGVELHQSHPAIRGKTPDELSHCLPLLLHADAAPYAKKKSAVFVQWGSLLGLRHTMVTIVKGNISFLASPDGTPHPTTATATATIATATATIATHSTYRHEFLVSSASPTGVSVD